ncbi:MAG: VWA domain-containing protein [Deltaproteobacteria bacterium]|nr:VWA domain-containing protein [Candidatus Anaeroferrophillus wilburensis]MBN2888196.1 VWA domain-containing protein [Deltaproteobacteria bacterium]
MFTPFFYTLKAHKVPVTLTEWLVLLQAMEEGFGGNSLVTFYYLARSLLVKSENYYDQYDLAFREYFTGLEVPEALFDELLQWLSEETLKRHRDSVDLSALPQHDWETLQKMFKERMAEQQEAHHGGNRWIGTGGTSPFGHGGVHPGGIRVGGESNNLSAVKIATERKFRNYRKDLTLDVRQIKVALKKLRHLRRTGTRLELDIDESIDQTCKNAGEIELVYHPERKNDVKLLLLMDAGGSMLPYAKLVNRLFSAANSVNHFKSFTYYYFHNCIYDYLRTGMVSGERIATAHLLKNLDSAHKVIIVGDASMAPYELFMENGIIDYYDRNETAGIVWLERIASHFRNVIWLNPTSPRYWGHPTVSAIAKTFPMHHLSLEGLESAMEELTRKAH